MEGWCRPCPSKCEWECENAAAALTVRRVYKAVSSADSASVRFESVYKAARIYAEHPEKGFLPGSGVVSHLRTPADEGDTYIDAAARGGAGTSGAVRVDLGIAEGDEVSVHYDPMLAKLITRGPRAILGAIHGAILTHCFGAIRLSGPTPLFRRCRPRRCAPSDGVGVGGVAGARNSGAILRNSGAIL